MPWNIEGILERIGIIKDDSVGIAFSGGGARGFSHLGVLKAMEHFGITPSVMAGVSSGSIAAALYGAGLSPDEIMACFAEANGLGYFTEWAIPKEGFMRLNRFAEHLSDWLPVSKLEEMKIPTVICATDLDHGKSVGWLKGDIVPRVVASCSIPIVFHPVVINGVHYVDGGVLRNLPAWAIRDYCRTLFGSNCSPIDTNYTYSGSLIQVALRSYRLMASSNTSRDLQFCDHVIQTNSLIGIKTFQLSVMNEALNFGYEAACPIIEKALNSKR